MSETAPVMQIVRARRGGRVTIPAAFRKALGITDETPLRMSIVDGELRIKPVRVAESSQGSPWLRELYEYFAPVREEILRRGISEEEVNADIDAAIAAVRAERRARRQ
jgi:bifunctional DNA-binding transcriptional regulator/antitoxin component of YhaV-PrlF toxin-antitoxin module